jgi:hypothetical protein
VNRHWKARAATGLLIPVLLGTAAAVAVPVQAAVSAPAATCSPRLQKVALSPAAVPGGAGSTVTATLNCATPRALTIGLKGFAGVSVPAAVHVAAGKSSASAGIATATTKTARRGWIVATLGGVRREALLSVGVTPRTCASPVLASATLPALAYVGDHPVLALRLSCVAGAPVHVSVKSSNASLPVPATVTIGKYYSAVNVSLTPRAFQPGQYQATITVHYGTKTLTRAITVNPGLSLFTAPADSCSPNSIHPDIQFTGLIPAGGLTVKLKSDNPAITVPATASFTQPGSIGAEVPGVTVNPVSVNTKVTLSATLGSRTLATSVTLLRPWTSGDKITLAPYPGPGPFYGPSFGYEVLVNLSNPAPLDNGLAGTATSDHPGDVQNLESQVSVAPGCTDGVVSFEVPYEAHPVHATVTVTLGGSTAMTSVTIEPSIASVTVPATITGGQSATGTVTLAGAPDAPDTVNLQSDWGILTVPNSVTIPAGQTSATFPITTVPVDSDSPVSISAWHTVGGSQLADSVISNTIDVTPAAS